CQHWSSPMPEALAAEVAAGQVLGEGERPDRDAAHDRPVRDPGLRLLRGLDRYGGGGTAAPAPPAPERPSAPAAKEVGGAGGRLDGIRERGRHTPRPQEAAQPVLVLAELDHRSRGEERATRKPAPGAGERPHLLIGGGNDQVDADMIEQAPQVAPEGATGHG